MYTSWADVGDEAAVVSHKVAGSAPRQRLMNQGGDVELNTLPHWKPVQLAMWSHRRVPITRRC